MKKRLLLLVSCVALVGLMGCTTEEELEYQYYQGDFITIGITETPETDYLILNDFVDIENKILPGIKDYSEDFFNEHSIIVVKEYSVCPHIDCNIDSVVKKSDKITVNMNVSYTVEVSQGYKQCNFVYVELKCKSINEVNIIQTETILENNK